MKHKEEAMTTVDQEERTQSMNANRPGAEYFQRYERGRGVKESAEDSNMDYWLSEEEDQIHQLKRQTGRSRIRKQLHVVQDAKAPKLRPATGNMTSRPSNHK